jgi:hypothetical protein
MTTLPRPCHVTLTPLDRGFAMGAHGPVLTVGIYQGLLTFDLATDVPSGAGLARAGRGAAQELRLDPFGLALHTATAVDEPTPVAHVDGAVAGRRHPAGGHPRREGDRSRRRDRPRPARPGARGLRRRRPAGARLASATTRRVTFYTSVGLNDDGTRLLRGIAESGLALACGDVR